MNSIMIYDRRSGTLNEENVYKEGAMHFLYGTKLGFALSEFVAKHRSIQDLYALWQERKGVDARIGSFIETYGINIDEIEHPLEHYRRFDDFFTRRLKPGARPLAAETDALVSPADSKAICFRVNDSGTGIPFKGQEVPVKDLLGDPTIAEQFTGGTCVVFRLAPADYHRFCYVDDGEHSAVRCLPGLYRAVSPLSLHHMKAVFTQNRRDVTLINGRNLGIFAHVDVGALAVGRIYQNFVDGGRVRKGQEKGYFGFGGSTIILLFRMNLVDIDEDIIKCSHMGIETQIYQGERIGRILRPR